MWQITLNAALLGAHIQKKDTGFRQRDVKFLMELFWNWQSSVVSRSHMEPVHNNQMKRTLQQLVQDSMATMSRSKPPKYKLTRAGLISILEQIRNEALTGSFDAFLFGRYLFQTYRDRFSALVQNTGTNTPLAFRHEIKELLDTESLEEQKRSSLKKAIAYLKERISETEKTVNFSTKQLSQKIDLQELARQVETMFPYELNYQKPLTQLFKDLPEDLQKWELTEGNRLRIEILWKIKLRILEDQLKLL